MILTSPRTGWARATLNAWLRGPGTGLYARSSLRILETARIRLVWTSVIFSTLFCGVTWRLVDLAQQQSLIRAAPAQAQGRVKSIVPIIHRADVTDRNGEIIATSLMTASLYANPQLILDPQEAAAKLIQVIPELKEEDLVTKLTSDKSFIWIKRNLTPAQQDAINRLGLPGLAFQAEEKRLYPHGPLFSHLIGYTDRDNQGISGVEKSFDSLLIKGGGPLKLAVDGRIQYILRKELWEGMSEFKATMACGVVLDTQRGEILAAVSLPDFDPNKPGQADKKALFNNLTLGSFEMGSLFKIFTVAMALDGGVVTLNSRYDARAPLRVGRFLIKDTQARNCWLNVSDIFVYSSNIGTAQIALDVGAKAQRAFFERLGFLEPLALNLPEVGSPIVPINWRPSTVQTLSYGYGLSVSPLQVAGGIAAMVNGGVLKRLTLQLREGAEGSSGYRVISEETSHQIRLLMERVAREGTGRKAQVPGYGLLVKTGSAHIAENGRYQTDKRTSCVAVMPSKENPRYLLLVLLERPKSLPQTHGFSTAGWNAAPISSRIIQGIVPFLGLAPNPKYMPMEEPPAAGALVQVKNGGAFEEAVPEDDE